jgi:ATP-dependent DNA ligase
MLLGSWEDLDDVQVEAIEQDHHAWIIQPKMDGVRALVHIEEGHVRITSRTVSEVIYRLSEFQDNLPHLAEDLSRLNGTILDGELVCPVSSLDTGSTVTGNSLQATMAVLAASPNKARQFQEGQHAHIRFHVFDILRTDGQDVTQLPLMDRQDILATVLRNLCNNFIQPVPSFVVNKPDIHRHIIDTGGEGTVWKKVDSPYEPGRRVNHWIKRKRGINVEAFIIGFKPGTNGHGSVIGAVEFGIRKRDGSPVPVGWVTGWSDEERRDMTHVDLAGKIILNPAYLGRKALIQGQDHSAKSRRLRHARIVKWC